MENQKGLLPPVFWGLLIGITLGAIGFLLGSALWYKAETKTFKIPYYTTQNNPRRYYDNFHDKTPASGKSDLSKIDLSKISKELLDSLPDQSPNLNNEPDNQRLIPEFNLKNISPEVQAIRNKILKEELSRPLNLKIKTYSGEKMSDLKLTPDMLIGLPDGKPAKVPCEESEVLDLSKINLDAIPKDNSADRLPNFKDWMSKPLPDFPKVQLIAPAIQSKQSLQPTEIEYKTLYSYPSRLKAFFVGFIVAFISFIISFSFVMMVIAINNNSDSVNEKINTIENKIKQNQSKILDIICFIGGLALFIYGLKGGKILFYGRSGERAAMILGGCIFALGFILRAWRKKP